MYPPFYLKLGFKVKKCVIALLSHFFDLHSYCIGIKPEVKGMMQVPEGPM